MKTKLTELLNIEFPIIQAPIGSATTPGLAAAVSNAGGLGMLALSWTNLEDTRAWIRQTKSMTEKPFGVNFILQWDQSEKIKICIDEQVPVVSFAWGNSTSFIDRLKARGIKVCQTVGSSKAAMIYENFGVDFIVAQGWEAGGHVLGTVASSALVPSVADRIRIPLVSAGGFADGRGLLAALSLGADGIWVGTRFLMSKEANVNMVYQLLIGNADEDDTVYADRLFNEGWDFAQHRVIRNSTVRTWERAGKPEVGFRPGEGESIAINLDGKVLKRYSDEIPVKTTTGDVEALALYGGQTIGIIKDEILPAEIIVKQIADEAKQRLCELHTQLKT